MQVGQTVIDGETFRNRLSLPSACFELTLIEEDVRLVTMGNGHGFGLSQYTAGKMAEAGSSLSFEAALSPSPLAVCKEDKVMEPGPHTAGH